jgi:hypothetical protein
VRIFDIKTNGLNSEARRCTPKTSAKMRPVKCSNYRKPHAAARFIVGHAPATVSIA